MGNYFFDQYFLLHYAVGVVAYFWGVDFWVANLLHLVFELTENTAMGMWVINNIFTAWPGTRPSRTALTREAVGNNPGGKPRPDACINMVSDCVAFGLGWLCSQWLDNVMGDPY